MTLRVDASGLVGRDNGPQARPEVAPHRQQAAEVERPDACAEFARADIGPPLGIRRACSKPGDEAVDVRGGCHFRRIMAATMASTAPETTTCETRRTASELSSGCGIFGIYASRARLARIAATVLDMQPLGCVSCGHMDAVFVAVADPTRRLLLERLRDGGAASIQALGEGLPMTRQAVTKHLDVLRDAGLVRVRRDGRERVHELESAPLAGRRRLAEAVCRGVGRATCRPAAPPWRGVTMTTSTTVAAIERQLDFRAAPERLWRALTDEAELSAWFGNRAHLDLRPGGDGWIEFEGYGRVPVRFEVVEPVTRLSWRWGDVGKSVDDGSTLVEFRLEPLASGGTRLHLRESGFTSDESRWSNTDGWLTELAELAAYVAVEPWQAGIRRTYTLTSPVERVWARVRGTGAARGVVVQRRTGSRFAPGAEGSWLWPSEGGRFAYRIEAVEPPRYLCWSWVATPNVDLRDAEQVLRTEWVLVPREDGGTDLHLFETGFTGPARSATTPAAGSRSSRHCGRTSARPERRRPFHPRPANAFARLAGRIRAPVPPRSWRRWLDPGPANRRL